MWALLGDIEFELLDSPQGQEHRFSADFAQHALIGSKPRLEAVAAALDELTWDIRLHHMLGDVQSRVRRVREALLAQEPLVLVTGDGEYRGPWVLTEGEVSAEKTSAGGELLSATMRIVLLEYAGELPETLQTPGLLDGLVKPDALKMPSGLATPVQQVAQFARKAESAVRAAQRVVEDARALIKSPTAALALIPGIDQSLTQASNATRELIRAGTEIARPVAEIASIVKMGTDLVGQVKAARDVLLPPRLADLGSQLTSAADHISGGLQTISNARQSVLRVTSLVARRLA